MLPPETSAHQSAASRREFFIAGGKKTVKKIRQCNKLHASLRRHKGTGMLLSACLQTSVVGEETAFCCRETAHILAVKGVWLR